MEQDYSKEKELLDRFNKGLTTDREKAQVDHAFNEFARSSTDHFSMVEVDDLRNQIWARLPASTKSPQLLSVRRPYKLWPWFAVAAMVMVFGIWIYNSNEWASTPVNDEMAMNDIAPGAVGATLTLNNGKKIRLSDTANGEVAKESGVVITKSANGQLIYEIKNSDIKTSQINVLTTAKGETYQVHLPDGSLVFLNAGSSLRYPTNFARQKNRLVSLTGEGYFEVSKDKTHPFIVESGNQRVEVLGTHFNINSYADEPAIKTTLLEGQIKVASLSPGNTGAEKMDWKILTPGDQSLFQGEKLTVRKVDVSEATAWKNGEFLFNEDDFRSAMRKLARWYDVEIVYAVSAPEKFKLGGFISRNKNISAVLKLIELTGDVHFIVEGRRITVTK